MEISTHKTSITSVSFTQGVSPLRTNKGLESQNCLSGSPLSITWLRTLQTLLLGVGKEQTAAHPPGSPYYHQSQGVVNLASLWLPTRAKFAWPIKGGCFVGVLCGSNVTSECIQKTQDFKPAIGTLSEATLFIN